MKRFATVIGIVMGIVGVLGAQVLDHGSPGSLINPSALMLIVLGTVGATLASSGLEPAMQAISWLKQAMTPTVPDIDAERDRLIELAKKARRAGLLQLEQDAETLDDPYLRRGLDNAIAGMEPEVIEDQMDAESQSLLARDLEGSHFFETAGGYSPTMGIIGTVVGLISVLSNVSDIAKLASSIATAFTATLWGILLANLVWLPISQRLHGLAQSQRLVRDLQSAAIASIARGDSSRQLERQLASMLAGHQKPAKAPKGAKGRAVEAGGEADAGAPVEADAQ